MKSFRSITATVFSIIFTVIVSACHPIEDFDDDARGNFEALWKILDEHYCFFEEKDVDWNAIHDEYLNKIPTGKIEITEFFDICADMLEELKDGHVNLSSSFAVSYYRKWWSDYPQNFDWRLIQEHYLNFDYTSGGGISYKLLEDRNVGYMRYSSFSSGIGDNLLDIMLYSFRETDGLIIDVRDNGGGDISRVETLVSRFIDKKILAGSIAHKTGSGHHEISEPYEFYYEPNTDHIRWLKPVVVLTNRSTFSAANNFVATMKSLPNVFIVGTKTGGGSGMPFSSELPCGWTIRFSASPVYDPAGNLTENGVEPSPGCEVMLDKRVALEECRDTMLEFAIKLLNDMAANKAETPESNDPSVIGNCRQANIN